MEMLALILLFAAATALPDCPTYCQEMNQWCNSTNAQFYPMGSSGADYCQTVCPTYITTGDNSSWDSYDCRIKHLNFIIGGQPANVHCIHAGTTGGGPTWCSDACNFYCDLVSMACNASNQVFVSKDWCLKECYAYPVDASANLYTVPGGMDTQQCRIYHSTVAMGSTDPAQVKLHCGHANASGGEGTCGTSCQNYCDGIQMYCNNSDPTQKNQQFASVNECLDACAKYPHNYTGTVASPLTWGNSFECRKYHLIQGATTGAMAFHCPHAGPTGGSVCVDGKSAASSLAPVFAMSFVLSFLWLLL